MSVVVNAALAGPKTSRYSNVYGALSNNGVLPNYGRTDMLGSGSSALSRLTTLIDSLGGILWLPNQHNYTLTTDTAVAPLGDPVGYMGSHRQNLPENYVKNSMMVGGTSSAPPSDWSVNVTNGITTSVVGMGFDADGYPYQDVRISGTATATAYASYRQIAFDPYTPGSLFSLSGKLSIIAGTTTGFDVLQFRADSYTAAEAYVNTFIVTCNLKAQSMASHSRYSASGFTSTATAVKLRPFVLTGTVLAGQTVDITIRISQPQLERGKPTAFTPTYGEAITRGTNFEPAWQDTTANKPLLGVDADGKGILTYDGSNDFFRTGIQTPEAGYIAGVWATSVLDANTRSIIGSRSASPQVGAQLRKSTNNRLEIVRADGTNVSVGASTTDLTTAKTVLDAHFSAADWSVRTNGAGEATASAANNPASTNYFRIGAAGAGGDTQVHYWLGTMLAQIWIPGARPGATIEAEIRRLLAEITAVSGVV